MTGTTCLYIHFYGFLAIVVSMRGSVTTKEAAQQLGVAQNRVRALISAGTLRAERMGAQWLVDSDSLARHTELMKAGATTRSLSTRVAWSAAALCDGAGDNLSAAERYRLRKRLARRREGDTVALVRRWLSRRADEVVRYRIGSEDIAELLATDGVVATGVSAIERYGLAMATGGSADAYVGADTRDRLVEDFYLIESVEGNLALRIVSTDMLRGTGAVAHRLIVGVDLAEDNDVRTCAVGRELIDAALRAVART